MFWVQFLTLLHLPRGPSLRLVPKDASPVDIKAHPASGQAITWFSGSIWAFFLVRPKWRIWPQTAGLSFSLRGSKFCDKYSVPAVGE